MTGNDPITAIVDQLAAHAEQLTRLGTRHAGHHAAVSARLAGRVPPAARRHQPALPGPVARQLARAVPGRARRSPRSSATIGVLRSHIWRLLPRTAVLKDRKEPASVRLRFDLQCHLF